MDHTNREADLKHQRTRTVMRLLGPILLALGVIFTAVGFISFFMSFGTFQPPRYFLAAIVGLPMIAIGLAITQFGYIGAYFRYFSGEVTPVATDTFNDISRDVRQGLETMAQAAGRGFSTGLGTNRLAEEETVACARCESPNSVDARFCNQCGTPLKGNTCADCGAVFAAGSRFCNHCGKAVG